jgi:hypothetical protein
VALACFSALFLLGLGWPGLAFLCCFCLVWGGLGLLFCVVSAWSGVA